MSSRQLQSDLGLIAELVGAKVAFVNWRDPADGQAGGAEVYCWEIARRLAAGGVEVTLFSSRPKGVAPRQHVDGIEVVRRGGTFSVYAHAALFLARHRGRFDAVVDCQNGIPFFSPLFVRRSTAVVCVIHHVHQEQFGVHFGWPLRLVGRELEGRWSRVVYGRRPLAVVSPSTQTAVRNTLGLRGPIFVVPNGAPPIAPDAIRRRSPTPLICCVGRLSVHKRMDLLVHAARDLRSHFPGLAVEIAGDGPDRARLQRLASDLRVDDVVRFRGHVPPETKEALFAAAWLTVNPSIGEGWGLGVLEANAHGVPSVAYSVPGLRDSVRDGVTGWLVAPGEDLGSGLAEALATLTQPEAAQAWAARCRAWAARFNWEESTRRLAGMIVTERTRRSTPHANARRAVRDVACLVEATTANPERLTKLASGLRRTDLWSVQGNQARMLLHGTDEHAARRVVERLDLDAGVITTSLANGFDLLVGPGLDPIVGLGAGLANATTRVSR